MGTLNKIADRKWEVFIIGGGIYGAAVARDAALRGLKTALVERGDYAGETSSRSTKLVHGGIRYLEQLQINLVHECLKERSILLTIAPHLVRPLPFLLPVFKNDRFPLPIIKFGTWLYGQLASKDTLKAQETYSRTELKNKYPFLADSSVTGGIRYFDAQMDDIRVCLETILSAQLAGAETASHVEVTRISMRDDGKYEVYLQDRLSKTNGSLRAASIVNATGPWADKTLSLLLPQHKPMLKPSKGIHLILKQKISDDAIVLSSSDKRVIFMIPWKNGSLVGTTDTPLAESLDSVHATAEEVDFLLSEIKKITRSLNIRKEDIITTFAGVRPLAALPGRNTSKVSRTHLIHENPKHFFSIVGGKYTTHRLIAEQMCDLLVQKLEKTADRCKTAELPLIGSFDLTWRGPGTLGRSSLAWIPKPTIENLARIYGERVNGVLAVANRSSELGKPFCTQHSMIGAQIIFAIEQELAQSLTDICVGRLRLDQTICRGLDCVHKAADIVSSRLSWSHERKESEVTAYLAWVKRNTQFLR